MRAIAFISTMSIAACANATTVPAPQTTVPIADPPPASSTPKTEAPKDTGSVLELGGTAKYDGQPLCPADVKCRTNAESSLILPLIAKIKETNHLEAGLTILVDPAMTYHDHANLDPSVILLGDAVVSLGNQRVDHFTLGALNDARRWKVVLVGVDLAGPAFRLTLQHTAHVSRGGRDELDATCTHPATDAVIDVSNLRSCLDVMASQKPWTTINFYPEREQKMSDLFSIFAMLPPKSAIALAS